MKGDITPALTAEEWKHLRKTDCDGAGVSWAAEIEVSPGRSYDGDGLYPVSVLREHEHALAALCLYGQPFGFTADDVSLLRQLADPTALMSPMGKNPRLLRLAERIAALLPPP